jgi:hypothetical protein
VVYVDHEFARVEAEGERRLAGSFTESLANARHGERKQFA